MTAMPWSIPAVGEVNLFFALLPPPALAAEMAALGERLRRAHGLSGGGMGPGRLHLTLANCLGGEADCEEAVRRALAAARDLRRPGFDVMLDHSTSFNCGPGRYPLVLASGVAADGLRGFREALCGRMRRAGLTVTGSFTPHVTLIWADRLVGAHPIAPLRWTATEFVLVKSLVGRSHHVHLGRWPLATS